MKLYDKNIKIGEIMLDPLNPRFGKRSSYTQVEILSKLLGNKAATELTNSMNQCIRWVNKIVVMNTNDLASVKRKIIPEVDNYKYIVIEGNNRLACLKSGKVKNFDKDTEIPVLLANKEENESVHNYEMQIKIIQGIANVMTVKPWKTIPKAAHLYNLYEAKREVNPNMKLSQIISNISYELGMTNAKVKEDIIRYAFFKEVNELSDTIEDDDWGYLEAIDNTVNSRTLFGMCKNSLEFEWNKSDEDYPSASDKQDLLIQIPDIIKSAKKEYPNSKKFRDVFKNTITKYDSLDEIKNIIADIINPEENKTWATINEGIENYSSEEKFRKELETIYNKIDSFPVGADWAAKLKDQLENIKNKIEKYLKIIEL